MKKPDNTNNLDVGRMIIARLLNGDEGVNGEDGQSIAISFFTAYT